jgi:hypothetical protein
MIFSKVDFPPGWARMAVIVFGAGENDITYALTPHKSFGTRSTQAVN